MGKEKSKNVTEEEKRNKKLGTYWDSMGKRFWQKYPELLLPFLNIYFGKKYEKNAQIEFLNGEHIVLNMNGKPQGIRADCVIRINGRDLYHIELQRIQDGKISCRFLEYDIEIALNVGTIRNYRAKQKEDVPVKNDRGFLHYRPQPMLVNLTHTIHEPDLYESMIRDVKGNEWLYQIQVINIHKFSMEEIEQKDYDLLLPFLPIRVWEKLNRRKLNHKNMRAAQEELVYILRESRMILEKRTAESYTSPAAAKELWEGLLGACQYLFQENQYLLEEVKKCMEEEFYFWDERLAMEKEKVAVLQAEKEGWNVERAKLLAQNEKLQEDLENALERLHKYSFL